ncbi:hypothetical protein EV177_001984 [Coemansia sp. RSA 1804]|nr:hypothetical protein EV177_001984 [Coemansia sp. RSA 1804]
MTMLRAVGCRVSQRPFGSRAAFSYLSTRIAASLPAVQIVQTALSRRNFATSSSYRGRPRQFEDHLRYPRARSKMPPRPETLATENLIKATNNIGEEETSAIEKIKVTDEEVGKIFDSIMSTEKRKERDEQSLRHKSRAEYLEMVRVSKEKRRLSAALGKDKKEPKQNKDKDEKPSADREKSGRQPISEKTMEKLMYMDTRTIREMEEAKLAVLASADQFSVKELQNKVKMTNTLSSSIMPNKSVQPFDEVESVINSDAAYADLAVPELKTAEFNHVIFANTLAGRLEEAVQAYELMSEANVKPDQTTFANLTMAYAKAGDLETAISMFKKLEEEGLEPTMYSYGTLIHAYREFNRIDDAFRVYETMKKREIWPNTAIYNSLIVACLKIGDFKRAWGVFEHLRYAISEPETVSFSIMINACAKNGEVEKAINLFEEMISKHMALSDVTFNSLIHACAVRPDYFDECFRLLHMMETHGFEPDFYTYNTIIYACARKRNLGLARDIFKDMLKKSMDPKYQELVKVDSITIANMMWAYAGYQRNVKCCSWKIAKSYENIAMEAFAAVKDRKDGSAFAFGLNQMISRAENKYRTLSNASKLNEIQFRSLEAINIANETTSSGEGNNNINGSYLDVIDVMIPQAVPESPKSIGSEATRLMYFYLDYLKGDVTSQLLNAYLSATINNGRYYDAWYIYLGAFKKYGVARDGWTFQRIIRLCERTRDVPSAWRVWDEYKAWRADVERALNTPGWEKLKTPKTRVYARDVDEFNQPIELDKELQSPNTATQGMLNLAESLVFPGESAIPTNVAGGSLAVLPADRETARRRIGCDMKTEHAMYIEMITLLGSNRDINSAIRLIREEKTEILEHAHAPTMEDVLSLYQNAIASGNKDAGLDIRGLCMQKPAHPARRALNRKWGTSFGWDRSDTQHKAMSRRFPEEFRRHVGPFKDGEYVRLKKLVDDLN